MLVSPDIVYASAIFTRSLPAMERLKLIYPNAIVGGTVFDRIDEAGNYIADKTVVEQFGITTKEQDYSIYPGFLRSIGFTQRGCRLACYFCGVSGKEGAVRQENTIWEIWRGDPYPREIHLLDNDFFGQDGWQERINEIRYGNFKVSFTQGINARFLTEESAKAIASVDYRDDGFKFRRIYTAWDSLGSEARLFEGLNLLVKAGVARSHIMVYMLIGGRDDSPEGREYRRRKLREFGALPYPMPYLRTPELVGFARWVITHADQSLSWEEWVQSVYQIRRQSGAGRLF